MVAPVSEKEYLDRLSRGIYFNSPILYVQDVFADPQNPGHSVVPDEWQAKVLDNIAKNPLISVTSGHGIGKTALSSWLIHWFLATRDHPTIKVTANTANQLTSNTWRELKRWNDVAINGHHFAWYATTFKHKADPDTWFAKAIPWSDHNSEAFAGTHETRGVLMVFDESSAISDSIFNVAMGALTTEGSRMVMFGNPTRNTGYFRETFEGGKFTHRWVNLKVDSRTAKMTDKKLLQEWLDDYGEDSDFFRVRVRGEFPRQSTSQFISSEIVDNAMSRALEPRVYSRDPKILGVDVAKGGGSGDRHTICRRQGRKAWQVKPLVEIDTMELVGRVIDEYRSWNADIICVDGTGVGTGVVHRLQELGLPVVDVMVGSQSTDPVQYFNLRTELWGRARQWLRGEVDLDPDDELKRELISPEYDHTGKMQLRLEPKKYTRQRLGVSPDLADAFVITFAADAVGEGRIVALPVQQSPTTGWWTF